LVGSDWDLDQFNWVLNRILSDGPMKAHKIKCGPSPKRIIALEIGKDKDVLANMPIHCYKRSYKYIDLHIKIYIICIIGIL